MKAIRINTIINKDVINLKELEEYQGKRAEIIVLFPEDDKLKIQNVAGALTKFANPEKIADESSIWEKVIKDRYESH
jgi:hypothetical protein